MSLQTYFKDFFHLFFPQVCLACEKCLLSHEELLCSICLYHLPVTDFHLDPHNETVKQLWGKLNVERATSLLYLSKSSRVEKLMYQLKYANRPEIGVFFGNFYAQILAKVGFFDEVDLIIPIPIHSSKLRKRGYNQSSQFAIGLSQASQIAWTDKLLIRTKASVSQTKKRRVERYENVEGVFRLRSTTDLKDKKILLVDDVLTTGATICTAGNVLVDAGATVRVVTIARA